jgi:TPR repeat protein
MARLQLRSSVLESRTRSDGVEKRLLEAAEAGDAAAQCNLGILYDNAVDDNGHHIDGGRPQALRWLLAAAEQGLPRAQIKLAEVFAEAPGLAGGNAAACGWFLVAAPGLLGVHRDRARSRYERIAAQLTPVEIAEATRFARDWTPKRQQEDRAHLSPRQSDAGDPQ